MNISRKNFITSIISIFLAKFSFAKSKIFEEELKAEVEDVMKKHAHEESNESTCKFIEAEIDDWAHIHVMDGELDMFKVRCGSNETESGEERWVACMFKEHDTEEVKVLKCEMSV